jgi:hypothetical protein
MQLFLNGFAGSWQMRFRLRTLLIVVTVICVALAAVSQHGLAQLVVIGLGLLCALPPLSAMLFDWLTARQ